MDPMKPLLMMELAVAKKKSEKAEQKLVGIIVNASM
jgi:hypothetical protein